MRNIVPIRIFYNTPDDFLAFSHNSGFDYFAYNIKPK